MVDNIDDRLATLILKDYCGGLAIKSTPPQIALDLMFVNNDMLSKWDTEAGGKLNRGVLNDFLSNVKYGEVYIKHDISRCIQGDEDILVGERLLVNSPNGTNAQLLKMHSGEYMALNEANHGISQLPSLGSSISVYALAPCRTFRLLDKIWLNDMPNYEVTNNLWPAFNSIRDCIENNSFRNSWKQLLNDFSKTGLGTFVFCTLTNAVLRNQQQVKYGL